MVRKLIEWALDNRLIVILMSLALAAFGVYSFIKVNVEAYPDPAPAIIEVVAQYLGASAEEVERQVTIPLEVTLAGMPKLKYLRSKSLFGLSHLRCQFDYGLDFEKARQEVINRLQFTQQLPQGVTPQLSPETPTGEIYRYTLKCPKDEAGQDIYTLNDLKALQDWVLERQFRRVPGIVDVTSSGGTIRRYEVHPDPDRLRLYGITLAQLQGTLTNSNATVGGAYVIQGHIALTVRCVGLFGGGQDPVLKVLGTKDPDPAAAAKLAEAEKEGNPEVLKLREAQQRRIAKKAAAVLREEEERRLREIRQLVITSVNNIPALVDDIVECGPILRSPGRPGHHEGVVVTNQTRLGRVGLSVPREERLGSQIIRVVDASGKVVWRDEGEKVQCIILLRKGEDSLPVLKAVEAKVAELNSSSRMLPGVKIEPYYDRTDLINVTTETVQENLIVGMVLVSLVLLMFLSNIRSALIVAINVPLALLFAFAMLFLRGKSANLLSIGAVDFGIIVDSSVIMVENIFRHVSAGEHADLHVKDKVLHAAKEVERSLFYSTLIMVCALLPLFTMQGPEGQIFGPMADTYAFALAGALLLAFTISPVLCGLMFGHLGPMGDNFIVRGIKQLSVGQLHLFLNYRWATVASFAILVFSTASLVPFMGREFMPELEEGNIIVRGTFPVNVAMEEVGGTAHYVRQRLAEYPEVNLAATQIGRPDDGTDPTGFYELQAFVPLKPRSHWPPPPGKTMKREKHELIEDLDEDLSRHIPGVNWDFSQIIRDNVMESLSGVKGENSVKIIGPDLDELERLAIVFRNTRDNIPGVSDPGIFRIKGQTNLAFTIDRPNCASGGVNVADVEDVISTAVGGMPFTEMLEGERRFDIALRWPEELRKSADDILDIPVDVVKNTVTEGTVSSRPATPFTGASTDRKSVV